MILSDTKANRAYFCKGTVYTKSKSGDISKKIVEAIADIEKLQSEVKELRSELMKDWEDKRRLVDKIFSRLECDERTTREETET